MQPSEDLLLSIASRMPPQKECVVVRHAENEHAESYPPTNALAFQAWLSEALSEVPEVFRADVNIEFSATSGYEPGDHELEMTLSYIRPATEAEFAARVYARALNVLRDETQERRQFERLQAKYGKS